MSNYSTDLFLSALHAQSFMMYSDLRLSLKNSLHITEAICTVIFQAHTQRNGSYRTGNIPIQCVIQHKCFILKNETWKLFIRFRRMSLLINLIIMNFLDIIL